MTPEQRHKLEQVAIIPLEGECVEHLVAHDCNSSFDQDMSIADAREGVTTAVQTVRKVLAMPSDGPTARERDLAELLAGGTLQLGDGMIPYARLVLATETPVERAVAYLSDTGSPESASGRLLLRAAERALRASGDV